LAVQSIAGDDARALTPANAASGELPWTKAEMCKMVVGDEQVRGESAQSDPEAWKLLYGQYSWLCEIKHPTVHQSIYDAGSTAFTQSSYAVMTLPDVREDNLGTKKLICLIVLTATKGALEAFARGGGVHRETDATKPFQRRMDQVNRVIEEQLRDTSSLQVPFGIRDTSWGRKHLRKKIEVVAVRMRRVAPDAQTR